MKAKILALKADISADFDTSFVTYIRPTWIANGYASFGMRHTGCNPFTAPT
jgi:hypothetical protein